MMGRHEDLSSPIIWGRWPKAGGGATRGRPLRYREVLRILLFIVMLIAPDISDGASPGLWAYHQTIRAAEGAGVIALGSDAIPTDQEPPAGR
ncbi:MAG: hypothetical protein QOJ17_1143 [Rhodospirillaceae bacterium]|jgi:hypothetical protein|nr:hypothetical protein [Rhodospirillaceae bacterium]